MTLKPAEAIVDTSAGAATNRRNTDWPISFTNGPTRPPKGLA